MKKPFALIILDGVALNPSEEANAFAQAKTPILDGLLKDAPNTTLVSHGERVGLPAGQMGNSEVGHLNIGAGRVVMQGLSRINKAIDNKELSDNPAIERVTENTKDGKSALHLIGLLSNGGVHSTITHFKALLETALLKGSKRVYIHAISDGRDRPTNAAIKEIADCVDFIEEMKQRFPDSDVHLATLCGRFHIMDRDKRWDRVEKGYSLITQGSGTHFPTLKAGLESEYADGRTDEFIEPIVLGESKRGERTCFVQEEDSLLFMNFRADRMRELVSIFLSGESFEGFDKGENIKLSSLATLTQYDEKFDCEVLFPPLEIHKHFGEVLSENGVSQMRIAETEKYPHVTYFFNGGVEKEFEGEERVIVPSRRDIPTYDRAPAMSAEEVTSKILNAIEDDSYDVYIVNFANCDMVGHTGSLEAAITAVEKVDECLGRILEKLNSKHGAALVTADHGNCDQMKDYETGEAHTFHTTYPVPCILVSERTDVTLRDGGALCDIAPTCLDFLGIDQPKQMTGITRIVTSE